MPSPLIGAKLPSDSILLVKRSRVERLRNSTLPDVTGEPSPKVMRPSSGPRAELPHPVSCITRNRASKASGNFTTDLTESSQRLEHLDDSPASQGLSCPFPRHRNVCCRPPEQSVRRRGASCQMRTCRQVRHLCHVRDAGQVQRVDRMLGGDPRRKLGNRMEIRRPLWWEQTSLQRGMCSMCHP